MTARLTLTSGFGRDVDAFHEHDGAHTSATFSAALLDHVAGTLGDETHAAETLTGLAVSQRAGARSRVRMHGAHADTVFAALRQARDDHRATLAPFEAVCIVIVDTTP